MLQPASAGPTANQGFKFNYYDLLIVIAALNAYLYELFKNDSMLQDSAARYHDIAQSELGRHYGIPLIETIWPGNMLVETMRDNDGNEKLVYFIKTEAKYCDVLVAKPQKMNEMNIGIEDWLPHTVELHSDSQWRTYIKRKITNTGLKEAINTLRRNRMLFSGSRDKRRPRPNFIESNDTGLNMEGY